LTGLIRFICQAFQIFKCYLIHTLFFGELCCTKLWQTGKTVYVFLIVCSLHYVFSLFFLFFLYFSRCHKQWWMLWIFIIRNGHKYARKAYYLNKIFQKIKARKSMRAYYLPELHMSIFVFPCKNRQNFKYMQNIIWPNIITVSCNATLNMTYNDTTFKMS
jgi:hypothetical protein